MPVFSLNMDQTWRDMGSSACWHFSFMNQCPLLTVAKPGGLSKKMFPEVVYSLTVLNTPDSGYNVDDPSYGVPHAA